MSFTRNDLVPVSKGAVIRYLTDQGWQRQTSRDGNLVKLSKQDGDTADTIDLIFSNSAPPQQERNEVAAAIETLTQLYDVSRLQLTQSLANLSYDLILTRIPDEYVRHASIELGQAHAYMNGMRSFLAASATTEISGLPSFARTLKDAVIYANQCRFGHTFEGSFGFVIESPVGMNDAPSMEIVEQPVPFGRKVVQRISRGLASYSAAVAQDDPTPLTDPAGMSANMCDEVVGILEDTGISKFDFAISLSPEWAAAPDLPLHQPFRIERRYIDLLKDASARLRREEAPKTETVIGRIVRLETDGNPSDLIDDRSAREILLSWDSAEYGHIRVQIPLTPDSYLTALEAHTSGTLFAVSGILKRKGRGWILEDAVMPRLLK